MPKTVLVSNMPAPYRERVYELVANTFGDDFQVVYCQKMERDRQWNNVDGGYPRHFLKERVFSYKNQYERFVHYNPDVWGKLNELNPDVVITYGYNPTYIIAYLWAKLKRRRHIVFSDSSYSIENSLSLFHKMLRKVFMRTSHSYIAASEQAKDLLVSHGADESKVFLSYLCANNDLFLNYRERGNRPYDLMFSGRFMSSKSPFFFCEVAKKTKERLGHVKVLMIGDGPLKKEIFELLDKYKIDYDHPGFVNQEDLPKYYFQSKLFLFPTLIDCWGVVLNEACAAGMPVISTEFTGAAGELIVDGENGYILPLDAQLWTDKVVELLTIPERYDAFSKKSIEKVLPYTYENAAKGISQAILESNR